MTFDLSYLLGPKPTRAHEAWLARFGKRIDGVSTARDEQGPHHAIRFDNGALLKAYAPCKNPAKTYKGRPKSFLALLAVHEFIFDEHAELCLNQFTFEPSDLEDVSGGPTILAAAADPEAIYSPIAVGHNYWFWHPTERTRSGEPRLYFMASDRVGAPTDEPVGLVFLKEFAKARL